MAKLVVKRPESAPVPLGPYSPLIQVGEMIWGSALAGVEPDTGNLVGDSAYDQTRQALKLIASMLDDVGSGVDLVVSVTVFLKDIGDFSEMNRAYVEAFGEHQPTRSVVSVVDVPKPGARLTMNFVAVVRD